MAETKKVPLWTGKNEEEVDAYLSKQKDIEWHYTIKGNKKSLYLVKDSMQKCITRLTEVKW